MFNLYSRITQSLGLSYPEEFLPRIQLLKTLGEKEIEGVIHQLLSEPQHIVNRSEKMLLTDAIREAIQEEQQILEVEAPLLTFPRATPQQWNGMIDHIDTITGTYNLYVGPQYPTHFGEHFLKKFKGGPQIVPALNKALGPKYKVTMMVNAYKSPASRFILVLPRTIDI